MKWRIVGRERRQAEEAMRWLLEDANRLDAELAAKETDLVEALNTVATLRTEVAALRRQNLALDAQLDHMTRVNQALDAGITTTTPQEGR